MYLQHVTVFMTPWSISFKEFMMCVILKKEIPWREEWQWGFVAIVFGAFEILSIVVGEFQNKD